MLTAGPKLNMRILFDSEDRLSKPFVERNAFVLAETADKNILCQLHCDISLQQDQYVVSSHGNHMSPNSFHLALRNAKLNILLCSYIIVTNQTARPLAICFKDTFELFYHQRSWSCHLNFSPRT